MMLSIAVFLVLTSGVLSSQEQVLKPVPSSFRADNRLYLTRVVVYGFDYILANNTMPVEDSIFTPKVIDGKLYLQTANHRYACVINFTGRIGALDKTPNARRCPIEVVLNRDGTVSIKYLYRNKYMCRVNKDKDKSSIRANKDNIDETCKFTVEEL